MNYLPLNLRKNGFEYTQILREGRKAIYRQHNTATIAQYQVFLIKTRPEVSLKGKIIPSRECFPGNEEFGNTAWSFKPFKKAMDKFNSIPK